MSAIIQAEVLTKYSVAAAAGNTTAGTANGSLGDQISTTQWTGGSVNDLFDNISGAQNAASAVDYRCIFVHNSNASNTYEGAGVYLSAEVGGGAVIAVGADPTAESAIASGSAQAVTIADDDDAPAGVSFSAPTTAGTRVMLGDIPPGHCKAFWVRRTAANTAALSDDGVTIAVYGDTGSL